VPGGVVIPHVFITDEAGEVINDAKAGGGDVDWVEVVGHLENLSRQRQNYSHGSISVSSKISCPQYGHFARRFQNVIHAWV
jgi:hypothetical protein